MCVGGGGECGGREEKGRERGREGKEELIVVYEV